MTRAFTSVRPFRSFAIRLWAPVRRPPPASERAAKEDWAEATVKSYDPINDASDSSSACIANVDYDPLVANLWVIPTQRAS